MSLMIIEHIWVEDLRIQTAHAPTILLRKVASNKGHKHIIMKGTTYQEEIAISVLFSRI